MTRQAWENWVNSLWETSEGPRAGPRGWEKQTSHSKSWEQNHRLRGRREQDVPGLTTFNAQCNEAFPRRTHCMLLPYAGTVQKAPTCLHRAWSTIRLHLKRLFIFLFYPAQLSTCQAVSRSRAGHAFLCHCPPLPPEPSSEALVDSKHSDTSVA